MSALAKDDIIEETLKTSLAPLAGFIVIERFDANKHSAQITSEQKREIVDRAIAELARTTKPAPTYCIKRDYSETLDRIDMQEWFDCWKSEE